jgi:hypothetical protein
MSLLIADADLRSNKAATTFALQERHKHRREGLPSPQVERIR